MDTESIGTGSMDTEWADIGSADSDQPVVFALPSVTTPARRRYSSI